MNFHQLKVFYEVAKEKNFSAAGKKLFLTQPAVTLQVKNLEEHYDLKFFDRVGKKVILTDEGKILFDFADQIFNLSRQVEEALVDIKKISRGALRIGAVFTFGEYHLPILLGAFHKKHPRVAVQVDLGNTSQITENILLHKDDLAFVAYDPENEKLVAHEFYRDHLIGIVSPQHKFAGRESISIKELNGQPFFIREPGSSPRMILDEIFKRNGIYPEIVMESASTACIKKMVESGNGMAILSRPLVEKEIAAKTLKKLSFRETEIVYRYYLIHHKNKYLSRTMKAFMDLTLDFFGKQNATLPRKEFRDNVAFTHLKMQPCPIRS